MLVIQEEVQNALATGQPVVALESTIIAHGFPYPENLSLAQKLEEDVRGNGAVPATIAVIEGRAKIGLSAADLARLAAPDSQIAKAGARDLAVFLATKASAATTVSATSTLAAAAGIRVFATGGIGGVHEGQGWDVSADLISLSRLPLAVVSAGPKAVLDLPRTMEVLETLSVLVVGYGTDELPMFYSRDSGIRLEHCTSDMQVLAKILQLRWKELGQGGVLVANPIPEELSLPKKDVQLWTNEAHTAAEEQSIGGKDLTPFLLRFLADKSTGATVTANHALARGNAQCAARLAATYARLG